MLIKPCHYYKFKCIASECPDTCCAGWEIDVDSDTAALYASLEGDTGEYVREKLIHTCEGQKLCLEGERCRFLRRDNLCELILRLGDDGLCDICREHPRFYTEYGNLTAAGMGMCCPEAARLWLSEPCELVFEDDGYEVDDDERSEAMRLNDIICYIANGEGTLGEKLSKLIVDCCESDNVYSELRKLYGSIEVLDKEFPRRFSDIPCVTRDARYKKLAAYFILRYYFSLGEEMAIKFTAASLIMIAAMGGEVEVGAKDYSKEVEYDTDNLDLICGYLENVRGLSELCLSVLKA